MPKANYARVMVVVREPIEHTEERKAEMPLLTKSIFARNPIGTHLSRCR